MELFGVLAGAIVRGEATTFSGLLEHASALPVDARTTPTFRDLFALIRKLNWGFFKDVTPSSYPKVWREIALPHPKLPECGDLKRNLTISDIFIGILDLHGYTRFCEKNKNNLSMLQALDDTIQVDMVRLARGHDVVLQRRNGDEMLLVGASAGDLLAATLGIIDYFAKKGAADSQRAAALPDMHVSAGIAGGKKFTPLIITRDGDLSGGVVNTAARLQRRANELSGERSRIVVSRSVSVAFQAEAKGAGGNRFDGGELSFFDSGYIRFKGIEAAVCEVLHDDRDRYKAQIEHDMVDLYKSLDNGAWRDGLFNSLMQLLTRVYKTMPPFKAEALSNGVPAVLTNDNFILMAKEVGDRFRIKQDYAAAVEGLNALLESSRCIPDFDRLVLEYAELIGGRYAAIAAEFDGRIKARLKEKAETTLPAKYRQLYEEGRKGAMIQERLNMELRKAMPAIEISQLWNIAVDTRKGDGDLVLHSGKK